MNRNHLIRYRELKLKTEIDTQAAASKSVLQMSVFMNKKLN